MIYLCAFASGFLFGLWLYGKGFRAQSPFYREKN